MPCLSRYWIEYSNDLLAMTGIRPDAKGNTWVHYAAWLGDARVLKEVLSSAAAAAAADVGSMSSILPSPALANLLVPNAALQTPLHVACMRGDYAMIRVVMGMVRCLKFLSPLSSRCHFAHLHSCAAPHRRHFSLPMRMEWPQSITFSTSHHHQQQEQHHCRHRPHHR